MKFETIRIVEDEKHVFEVDGTEYAARKINEGVYTFHLKVKATSGYHNFINIFAVKINDTEQRNINRRLYKMFAEDLKRYPDHYEHLLSEGWEPRAEREGV